MSLPVWLDPLYSPQEMWAADLFAMEQRGILELELAEKAGTGLASVVRRIATEGPVRVVVGPGNNGGDGLVAARLLREAGYTVDVLAPIPLDGVGGVPRTNLDRLPGDPPRPFEAGALRGSGAIVDAMLGTGFEGAVEEPLSGVVAEINAQDAPVVAADVPSGVNAATGEVEGVAVRAGATSTNHAPKVGLYVAPGSRHAGTVRVTDIGIPGGAPETREAGLVGERVMGLLPGRPAYGSHRPGSAGVVVCGGSREAAGSVSLAAAAALRGGASRVLAAVPASATAVVGPGLPEAAVRALPENPAGGLAEAGAGAVLDAASAGSLVLGSEVGSGLEDAAFVRAVCRGAGVPVVLSPQALSAFASRGLLEELSARAEPTVIVTGVGELAEVLGEEPEESEAHRLRSVRRLAEAAGATVVLEGEEVLISPPDGPFAVLSLDPSCTRSLAAPGTDAVLSGLLGALLARGLDPFAAAAASMFALSAAGERAAGSVGSPDHTLASDLILTLPATLGAPGLTRVSRAPIIPDGATGR